MHGKNVLLISSDRIISNRVIRLLDEMDADVTRLPVTYLDNLDNIPNVDLVVVDTDPTVLTKVPALEKHLLNDAPVTLMLIVSKDMLSKLRFDVRIPSDFVLQNASDEEFVARAHKLLWPGEESTSSDFVRIDDMTVNLATYQVKVGGEPIDFTYLEYALLAFLITHPGRTYSRDALLRRVWGFEYYGGSRTVDVHVRRIRAKLGTELASRLKTVRGVGYLWNA